MERKCQEIKSYVGGARSPETTNTGTMERSLDHTNPQKKETKMSAKNFKGISVTSICSRV